MSTDLRTTLNAADNAGTWTGQGKEALNTTVGQYYEPSGSIEDQRSNADEDTYTSVTSVDLSDATCYLLSKDNLVDSFANGGVQYLLGDGTDRIGYDIGGFDASGMQLRYYYSAHKLDVSVVVATPGSFAVYAGSEANLNHAAITQAGIGTLHLAKAVGSIANCWVDYLSYHANGSYALRINGGTVGTPETMSDVQGDDETNGWGLVNNPLGNQYGFFGPTEWGEPAANADVYFTADGEQWFWIGDNAGGHAVGATHFPFRIVGNATDTIDIKWSNLVIVNTGTRAQFIAGDANVDVMEFDAVTFTNIGAITFPAQDNAKFVNNCIFNNCDQIDFDTTDVANVTINGTTDANGAIILDASGNSDNIIGASFVSDGTGHAVYITAPGTYSFDNWVFSGYSTTSPGTNSTPNSGSTDAMIYNNSGGAVTINVSGGGDTPTVRNGASATTTVNNNVSVTFAGLRDNTEVRIYTAGTKTELDGIENATAGTTDDRSFTASIAGGTSVDYTLVNNKYEIIRVESFTWPATNQTIQVQQRFDRNYANP